MRVRQIRASLLFLLLATEAMAEHDGPSQTEGRSEVQQERIIWMPAPPSLPSLPVSNFAAALATPTPLPETIPAIRALGYRADNLLLDETRPKDNYPYLLEKTYRNSFLPTDLRAVMEDFPY